MALRDIFKISRKTFIHPSGWIDLDSLQSQNRTIWGVLKTLFTPQQPTRKETFDEAMKRLGLTEADLARSAMRYRLYGFFFLFIALVISVYAFYLLFRYGSFLGWLLGIGVAGLFIAQAFKYDFWAFQIRRRKLGATFEEWKRATLGGRDTPP